MKLFIWRDTSIFGGSAFGGTIFAMAETLEEAKAKIVKMAEAYYDEVAERDYRFKGGLDASCFADPHPTLREELEKDLSEEPVTDEDCDFAYGGDL